MLSACLLSVSEVQVRVELSQLTQDCNNSVTKKTKYCWSYSDFSAHASKRHLFFFSTHVAIVVRPTKRTYYVCFQFGIFVLVGFYSSKSSWMISYWALMQFLRSATVWNELFRLPSPSLWTFLWFVTLANRRFEQHVGGALTDIIQRKEEKKLSKMQWLE